MTHQGKKRSEHSNILWIVNILKLSLVTLKAAQREVGKLLDISSIWLLHFEASNYKVLLVSTCDIIFVSRLQHLILNAPILLRGCLIATVSS